MKITPLLASLLIALALAAPSARASANYTWASSTTGGNWSTTANWTTTGTGAYPTWGGDYALLGNVTSGTRTVVQDIVSGMGVSSMSMIQTSNAVNLFDIQHSFTISGGINLGATNGGTSIFIVDPQTAGVTLSFANAGATINSGGVLQLNGVSGTTSTVSGTTGTLPMLAGAVTLGGGSLIINGVGTSIAYNLVFNSGTLALTSASSSLALNGTGNTFNSNFSMTQGTLALNSGSGTLALNGTAATAISGGTLAITGNNATISGTSGINISGTGAMLVTGSNATIKNNVAMTSGTFSVNGTNSSVALNGTSATNISGGTFALTGTNATVSGSSAINLSGSGVLLITGTNTAINNNLSMTSGSFTVNNASSVGLNGAAATSISGGTLTLGANATVSGSSAINLSGSGALLITGNNTTINNNLSMTSGTFSVSGIGNNVTLKGTNNLSGGTFALTGTNASVSGSTINMSGGVLALTGTNATINNNLAITGGTISLAGSAPNLYGNVSITGSTAITASSSVALSFFGSSTAPTSYTFNPASTSGGGQIGETLWGNGQTMSLNTTLSTWGITLRSNVAGVQKYILSNTFNTVSIGNVTLLNQWNTGGGGATTVQLGSNVTVSSLAAATYSSGTTPTFNVDATGYTLGIAGTFTPANSTLSSVTQNTTWNLTNSTGTGGIFATSFNLNNAYSTSVTGNVVLTSTGGGVNNILSGSNGTIAPTSTFLYAGTSGVNTVVSNRAIGRLEVGNGSAASTLNLATSDLTVGADVTVKTNSILDLGGKNLTESAVAGGTSGGLNGGGTIRNNTSPTTATLTLDTTNGGGSFSGNIVNNTTGTGTVAVTKTGTGTQILSGSNSYTGATTITTGSLVLNGLLGNTAVTVGSLGTLAGTGTAGGTVNATGNITGSLTFSNDVTVNGGATAAAAAFNGNIIDNGWITSGFNVGNGKTLSGSGTASGVVTASGNIAGSLTFNNDVTINHGATASASAFQGNIVDNGTITSAVNIQAGKALSGTGSVSNSVTVLSGGQTSAGNGNNTGVLTLDLTYNSGATANFNVSGSSGTTSPTALKSGLAYSQVAVSGSAGAVNLQIGTGTALSQIQADGSSNSGVALELTLSVEDFAKLTSNATNNYQAGQANTSVDNFFVFTLGSGLADGRFQTLELTVGGIDYIGTIYYSGTNDRYNGVSNLGDVIVNGQEFALSYTGDASLNSVTGGNDLVLTAIPEPATWAMLVGGIASLMGIQRMRRRS